MSSSVSVALSPDPLRRVQDPGGSALIGGVMMRCDRRVGMAARSPEGDIVTDVLELSPPSRSLLARLPVLRGIAAVSASLNASLPALAWSIKVRNPSWRLPQLRQLRRSALLGFLLFDALISALPALAFHRAETGSLATLAGETALRVAILLAYLFAIRRLPEVRELFSYHGAEHKTVAAYESRAPLTPEVATKHSIVHVRCGTAFVLWLVLAASLATPLTENLALWAAIPARTAFMLLAAGIAFEVLQLGARWGHFALVRWIMAPGLRLQGLTTREPSPDQLEVAIAAMLAALPDDLAAVERALAASASSGSEPSAAPGSAARLLPQQRTPEHAPALGL